MDNKNDMDLKFADRIQLDKSKSRVVIRMYASGKWHCSRCGMTYKQNSFIKETCEYCGDRLEKEW